MKRFTRLFPLFIAIITSFAISPNILAQENSQKAIKAGHLQTKNYKISSSLKSYANDKGLWKTNSLNGLSNFYPKTIKEDIYSSTHHKNEKNISDNYFRIDKSKYSLWDGKHWEESRFPLNIYLEESDSRYYKSDYKAFVKYALDVWRQADDRIQYRFVNSASYADIEVIFIENLGNKYEESYLGLTDYDTYDNKELKFSKIQISLIKNGNEKVSAGEIKATIIHELGHALGLGHSNNKKDLMYPYISPNHSSDLTYDELSLGDKLAIKDVINLGSEEAYVWK